MKITFIGQANILGNSATSQRIRALAALLTRRGHNVVAFSTTEKSLKNLDGAAIKYRPSFSPEAPGGWLYTVLSLFSAIRSRTDVIHLTTWRAGALAWLIAMISPRTTLIWTIDAMPRAGSITSKFVVWQANAVCDAITTPNRSLQYLLRIHFNILAAYIPDGYLPPAVDDIPAKHWNVRKGLYAFATAENTKDVRWILEAYKKTNTRKKLIVAVPAITPALKRLEKRDVLLQLIETASERQITSLTRQAAAVIFADAGKNSTTLLQAMHEAKPVIAVNEALYAEYLGTAGKVVRRGDKEYLQQLLADAIKNPSIQKQWGKPAQKRARTHFTWTRIFEEYEKLYHYPLVRRVPIDSVRHSRISQPAVY